LIDRALFDAERLGNLRDSQLLFSQGPCSRRRGLGCAWPASSVYAAFSGQGDANRLALLGMLQFDFSNAE
jgi:hypothetical protein